MKSKTSKCAQLLATTPDITIEELSAATGMKAATVQRLREDSAFIAEVNRLSREKFVAELPRVLLALIDAASDGKNASAMKLFLDTCRDYETNHDNDDTDTAGVELMARLVQTMKQNEDLQ